MKINNAKFIKSVGNLNQLDNANVPEIAFVGRSNVGKSSLINNLCRIKSLAKTSSTPGRTRLINYFLINNNFYFVDLPGYGFALGEKNEQYAWKSLIEGYLTNSKMIKLLCLLIDIRRDITDQDKMMLKYMEYYHIPFIIVVTKADKIAKSKCLNEAKRIARQIGVGDENVFLSSTLNADYNEKILSKMDQFLE